MLFSTNSTGVAIESFVGSRCWCYGTPLLVLWNSTVVLLNSTVVLWNSTAGVDKSLEGP